MISKNDIPKVKAVKPLSGYKLYLEFEDGITGNVDLSYLKGKGVFEWWEQSNNFAKVHIDQFGTIAWNDDMDIDVLNCYLKITNQTLRLEEI